MYNVKVAMKLRSDPRVADVERDECSVIVNLAPGYWSPITEAHSFDEDNYTAAAKHLKCVIECYCETCRSAKSA